MERVMKRKTLITLLVLALTGATFVLAACGGGESAEPEWSAMEKLEAISAEDITQVKYMRATEGGAIEDQTGDPTEIEDIYLRLKDVQISDKTDEAVEDDDMFISIEAGGETLEFSFMGDILVLDEANYKVDNLGSLKTYIDGLLESAVGPKEGKQDTTGSADPFAGSKDYDVSKGFQKQDYQDMEILYFNDFMITMPDNEKWSFEMNGNSVTFYLFSAQQEGYGGRLVTIVAYDIDDHSYEQLPVPYQVAGVGKNVNKRFIAVYPSDVQFNHADAAQEADYRDLYDYLKKIGEGAVNSPLQTADSD
jgi:hypothetical protein